MSVGMRIVYTCNHVIENIRQEVKIIEVTRREGLLDDVLSSGKILSVDSVYTVNKDTSKSFLYENIHYTHNLKQIEWIPSPDIPDFGEKYFVECLVELRTVEQYDDEECPRCMGNGWFCSLTESKEYTERFYGVNKMVQEYIKCIFTRRSSNEGSYGTDILDYIGKNVGANNAYVTEIALMVKDAENQCKAAQSESILNGDYLSDDEILEKVTVIQIYFDEDTSGIITDIRLESRSGIHKNIAIGVD